MSKSLKREQIMTDIMTDYAVGMQYKRSQFPNPVLDQLVDYAVGINAEMQKNGSVVHAKFQNAMEQTAPICPSSMSVDDLTRLYFSVLEDLPAMVDTRYHIMRQPRRIVNPLRFWPALAEKYERQDLAEFCAEMWDLWQWLVQDIQAKKAEPKEVRLVAYRA